MIIPMQTGWNVQRYFDPVYHASMPLEWNELSGVMDEINAVCNAAFPKWRRNLICLAPIGFILFAVGGFTCVATAGSDGPNPIAYLFIGLGMLLFIGGPLSLMCCLRTEVGMSDIRRKLSELNARYAQRGIDFQLHESKHLEYYSSGAMRVTDYALVVQALTTAGANHIPPPRVIASQAFHISSGQ
jgi:hypothetical protein